MQQGRLQPIVADDAALRLSAGIDGPAPLSRAAPQGLTGVTSQPSEQIPSDLLAVVLKQPRLNGCCRRGMQSPEVLLKDPKHPRMKQAGC